MRLVDLGTPRPHDLLLLRDGSVAAPWPGPVWAVVRRDDRVRPGTVPIGLRGRTRGERWAAVIAVGDVLERVRPADLPRSPVDPERRRLGAFTALVAVAPLLDGTGRPWGPGGSVGYELATGRAAVHPGSDLDLVLEAPEPWPPAAGRLLLEELRRAAGATRVDVQVQTDRGGFALEEWVRTGGPVALRTDAGPVPVADPWTAP